MCCSFPPASLLMLLPGYQADADNIVVVSARPGRPFMPTDFSICQNVGIWMDLDTGNVLQFNIYRKVYTYKNGFTHHISRA